MRFGLEMQNAYHHYVITNHESDPDFDALLASKDELDRRWSQYIKSLERPRTAKVVASTPKHPVKDFLKWLFAPNPFGV